MHTSAGCDTSTNSYTSVEGSTFMETERERDGRQVINTVMGNTVTSANCRVTSTILHFIKQHQLDEVEDQIIELGAKTLDDFLLLHPEDYQHLRAVPRRKLERGIRSLLASSNTTANHNPFNQSWFEDDNKPPLSSGSFRSDDGHLQQKPSDNPFEVGNFSPNNPFEVGGFSPNNPFGVGGFSPNNPFGVGSNHHQPSNNPFEVGSGHLQTFNDPFGVGSGLPQYPNHPLERVGSFPPNYPLEVGSDLSSEEDSPQAVPTNTPALQIEGSTPVEFAPEVLKGGSVGYAFERQHDLASVSEFTQHTSEHVPALGKAGLDPQIKLHQNGTSFNKGNAENQQGIVSNATSLGVTSFDFPEEELSQAVPTNTPALQIEGSKPVEFASEVLKGGSVGYVFERQHGFASVSEFTQHTPRVPALGKAGLDPQNMLDNISFRKPVTGEGPIELEDLRKLSDDDVSSCHSCECQSEDDRKSTIIFEPASKIPRHTEKTFFSTISDDGTDKIRPEISLQSNINADTFQMAIDVQQCIPEMTKSTVNQIVNTSMHHINLAVLATEAKMALDFETCKSEEQAKKRNFKQAEALSKKCILDLQLTNNKLLEQLETDRLQMETLQQIIKDGKIAIKTLNKSIVSCHTDQKKMQRTLEAKAENSRNDLLEKLHISNGKYQSLLDVESTTVSVLEMESKIKSLKASHEEELFRMRSRYANEVANSATETTNAKLVERKSPVKVSLGALKAIWNSPETAPSEGNHSLRPVVPNNEAWKASVQENAEAPGASTSNVSTLNNVETNSKVYDQSKAHVRNFFRQRKEKKFLIDKANRGATASASKAIGEIGGDSKTNYTNFQMGENIANGLKKQLEFELIDMLSLLDQTVLTKNSRAIHDLQPMEKLPTISSTTEAMAIAKLAGIYARDNLISMYPIYSDIVFLIESYDTTTGLFPKPRHCKSNAYATIQDDEERDAYNLASTVLYSELVRALSEQPTRLTTAQTAVQHGSGKFQTTAMHEDGVQLLFSLLCSILKDVGDIKQTMIKELTVCAEAQFAKYDPFEVVAALSDLVTQACNMGVGRPKIPYDQCIGTIAMMLIFREANFDSFLKDWKHCPDPKYNDDAVPLIRGFYSSITLAVNHFRKIKSFNSKNFWAKSAQAIDVSDASDRKIISKYETAYSASSNEDSDDENCVKVKGAFGKGSRRGKQSDQHDQRALKTGKLGFCQATKCPGRKGTGEGNAIGKQHLAWKPDSQLCSSCFFHCVKQETDIPLTDGTSFKYIAKPKKGSSSTDTKFKKWAKFAVGGMKNGSQHQRAFISKVQTVFPNFEGPNSSSDTGTPDGKVEDSLEKIQRLTAQLRDAEDNHESNRGKARTARASMQTNIDRINADEKTLAQTKSELVQRQNALSDELFHVEAVLADKGYSAKRTTA